MYTTNLMKWRVHRSTKKWKMWKKWNRYPINTNFVKFGGKFFRCFIVLFENANLSESKLYFRIFELRMFVVVPLGKTANIIFNGYELQDLKLLFKILVYNVLIYHFAITTHWYMETTSRKITN